MRKVAGKQKGRGFVAMVRKVLRCPESLSSSVFLLVFTEACCGLLLAIGPSTLEVDWSRFWMTSDILELKTVPWGAWLLCVALGDFLVFHAISVYCRKRWARILLGVFGLVGSVLTLALAIVLTWSAFAGPNGPDRTVSFWIAFLSLFGIQWDAMREGLVAYREAGPNPEEQRTEPAIEAQLGELATSSETAATVTAKN